VSAVTDRLINNVPSSMLAHDPERILSLRVRNQQGLVWVISGYNLTIHSNVVGWDGSIDWNGFYAFGATTTEYDLATLTIGQLSDALVADGHLIAYSDPSLLTLSAMALIDGSGDQDSSNGDHLYIYTSPFWTLMSAYGEALTIANADVDFGLTQMDLRQCIGEWADVWGVLFGVPRLVNELDADYITRIVAESFRIRVSPLAIEDAVFAATGVHVVIDEPWKRIFELDGSSLSGASAMQDGNYFTYHVIQPIFPDGTTIAEVDLGVPAVQRNKAVGVDVFAPVVSFNPRFNILTAGMQVDSARTDKRSSWTYWEKSMVLSRDLLSDPGTAQLNDSMIMSTVAL